MSQRGMRDVKPVPPNKGAVSAAGAAARPGTESTSAKGGGAIRGRRMTSKKPETRIAKEGPGTHTAKNRADVTQTISMTKGRATGCPSGTATDGTKFRLNKRKYDIIMADLKTQLDEIPMFLIEHVQFNLYSTKEIDEEAVVKVENTDMSGPHSVNDSRMGVFGSDTKCSKCQLTLGKCSGHLGKIVLARPVYHPLAVREITRVLNCVCNSCSGLLLDVDDLRNNGVLNLRGYQRLIFIEKLSKEHGVCQQNVQRKEQQKYGEKRGNDAEGEIKPCLKNPIYVSDPNTKNVIKYKFTKGGKSGKAEKDAKDVKDVKEINDVFYILDQISMEDARILGFSNGAHPRNMIMERLPVIPPCDRNMIQIDGREQQDQLTMKLVSIVRTNNLLYETLQKRDDVNSKKYEAELFDEIHTLISKSETKNGEGKAFQSYKLRIQGKEAAIRSALMGKRVNFSARTVISPDPSLKFGQIRIPEVMAPFITVPVRVTQYNFVEILGMLTVKSGPIPIRSFVKASGNQKDVEQYIDSKNLFMPEIGDTVNRWLRNGDYVIFNRQPTLHKYGMMSFQVILGKPYTIGLHLAYVTAFNADFDGDEGNLHLPQILTAYAEMAELMNVKNCIMNAQQNKPIMANVYDSLSGALKMTRDDVLVDPATFDDCLTLLVENGYSTNKPGEDEMLDRQFSVIQRNSSNVPRQEGESLDDEDDKDVAMEFEDRLRLHNMHTYVYEREVQMHSLDGLRTYSKRKEVNPRDVLTKRFYTLKDSVSNETCIEAGVDKNQEFGEGDVEEITYKVVTEYDKKTHRSKITRTLVTQEERTLDEHGIPRYRQQEDERKKFIELQKQRDANFRLKVARGGDSKEVRSSDPVWTHGQGSVSYELPTFETHLVLKGRPNCRVRDTTKLVWIQDQTVPIQLNRRITGKALFSMLLPPDFTYDEGGVVIRNGVLLKGTIAKKHIGTEHNSIVQVLWNRDGPTKTVDFLTNAPFIIHRWLLDDPVTISIADCSTDNPEIEKEITKVSAEAQNKVLAAGVDNLNSPVEERQRELNNIQYLDVQTVLATSIPKKAGFTNSKNNYSIMTQSGGKGAISNIVQIVGLLGQQYVTVNGQNERIPLSITGKTRALPHFPSNSADPRARGFVVSSFTKGLTMAETIFHSAGGREGLLDTATKTAETGSMHHRILKSLESIKINHVGAVVDHNGRVIQQVYGGDGMNPSKLENAELPSGEKVASFIRLDRIVNQINSKPRGIKYPEFRYGFTMFDSESKSTFEPTLELTEGAEENEMRDKMAQGETDNQSDNED